MTIEIKAKNGKWIVNGKTYNELNHFEKNFMDAFFREVKIAQKPINI